MLSLIFKVGSPTVDRSLIVNQGSLSASGGRQPMGIHADQSGARVLWCLRRKRSDVRCVLLPGTAPLEVHVLQDTDVVLKERFSEEWLALNWAREYGERLKEHGWRDSPAARAPSSAA